jgi:predicted signal transduction protein with EAL and GGDEF domain
MRLQPNQWSISGQGAQPRPTGRDAASPIEIGPILCPCDFSAASPEALRLAVLLARAYGADEFAVMAPEADAMASLVLAERIRSFAEDMPLPGGLRVTVSLGVASAAPPEGWTPTGILERADRALYEAKRRGRNRVVLDGEPADRAM